MHTWFFVSKFVLQKIKFLNKENTTWWYKFVLFLGSSISSNTFTTSQKCSRLSSIFLLITLLCVLFATMWLSTSKHHLLNMYSTFIYLAQLFDKNLTISSLLASLINTVYYIYIPRATFSSKNYRLLNTHIISHLYIFASLITIS